MLLLLILLRIPFFYFHWCRARAVCCCCIYECGYFCACFCSILQWTIKLKQNMADSEYSCVKLLNKCRVPFLLIYFRTFPFHRINFVDLIIRFRIIAESTGNKTIFPQNKKKSLKTQLLKRYRFKKELG